MNSLLISSFLLGLVVGGLIVYHTQIPKWKEHKKGGPIDHIGLIMIMYKDGSFSAHRNYHKVNNSNVLRYLPL